MAAETGWRGARRLGGGRGAGDDLVREGPVPMRRVAASTAAHVQRIAARPRQCSTGRWTMRSARSSMRPTVRRLDRPEPAASDRAANAASGSLRGRPSRSAMACRSARAMSWRSGTTHRLGDPDPAVRRQHLVRPGHVETDLEVGTAPRSRGHALEQLHQRVGEREAVVAARADLAAALPISSTITTGPACRSRRTVFTSRPASPCSSPAARRRARRWRARPSPRSRWQGRRGDARRGAPNGSCRSRGGARINGSNRASGSPLRAEARGPCQTSSVARPIQGISACRRAAISSASCSVAMPATPAPAQHGKPGTVGLVEMPEPRGRPAPLDMAAARSAMRARSPSLSRSPRAIASPPVPSPPAA